MKVECMNSVAEPAQAWPVRAWRWLWWNGYRRFSYVAVNPFYRVIRCGWSGEFPDGPLVEVDRLTVWGLPCPRCNHVGVLAPVVDVPGVKQ